MRRRAFHSVGLTLAIVLLAASSGHAQVAFQVATEPYESDRLGSCYNPNCPQTCHLCCDNYEPTCEVCHAPFARQMVCDAGVDTKNFDCAGNQIGQSSDLTVGQASCADACGFPVPGPNGCDGRTLDSVCQDARDDAAAALVTDGFVDNVKRMDQACCTADADGDGVPACLDCDDNDNAVGLKVDLDKDGVTACAGDCDDRDARRFPGHSEACDGVDNDCDTLVDEGDADGDGVLTCQDNCPTVANPGQ